MMRFRIEPEPRRGCGSTREGPADEAFEARRLRGALRTRAGAADPEPYERLLGDAITGVHTLFTRQDTIEETWRVVQPLLDDPRPGPPLRPRHLGPEADRGQSGPVASPTGPEPWLPGA